MGQRVSKYTRGPYFGGNKGMIRFFGILITLVSFITAILMSLMDHSSGE